MKIMQLIGRRAHFGKAALIAGDDAAAAVQ
jgi:hypothetical protein